MAWYNVLVGHCRRFGIMAENLAAGNMAIALLGNTIPTGAILVVLITILAQFRVLISIRR